MSFRPSNFTSRHLPCRYTCTLRNIFPSKYVTVALFTYGRLKTVEMLASGKLVTHHRVPYSCEKVGGRTTGADTERAPGYVSEKRVKQDSAYSVLQIVQKKEKEGKNTPSPPPHAYDILTYSNHPQKETQEIGNVVASEMVNCKTGDLGKQMETNIFCLHFEQLESLPWTYNLSKIKNAIKA